MAKLLSEWGLAGTEALRDEVAVLVIVDILSFSTAVDVALGAGGYERDVAIALEEGVSEVVPLLVEGVYRAA